ncbi:MAG: prepilin-type N-terminal cleavage/methylation domain-containing protein [Candidatus Melainabacteria bacterium]|nr:prepilin-type N-terminal cleavage/methylation domain-containing protein [Candidatus Melainabacteria bacterium]
MKLRVQRNTQGFTLIELLVVVVIIGILITLAVPNLIGAQDRAKNASINASVQALRANIAIATVDMGGVVPKDANEIVEGGLTKNLVNPFTNEQIMVVDGVEADMAGDICYQADVTLGEPFILGKSMEVQTQETTGGFVLTGYGIVMGMPDVIIALDNGGAQ